MKELTWSAAVGDFRTKGKCFALHGSFFIVLLLSIGHGSCRPEQSDDDFKLRMIRENTTTTTAAATKIKLNTIANGGEHDNADKEKLFILNHPEITYKEDYVNEDYKDPVKHSVKSDIPITAESYKRLKPEKMYFDVLPKKPVIVIENLPKKSKASRLKVNPLAEDVTDKQSNKLSHNERDEIVHLRKKRSTQTIADNQQNVFQALNPYFRNVLVPCSNCGGANGIRAQYILVNRPVPGKKHNALDIPVRPPPPPTDMPIGFDSRIAADENDRVIFSGGSRTTQRPVATRRPPESIFRDPNPGNFDFSFMNPGNQNTQSMRPMGPAGNAPRTTTMRPPAPPSVAPPPAQGNRGISQCVWAIVNCCSTGDSEIRYSCFEQNGCYGAFWDLNPCAESVRDNIITYVADYYD